MRAIDADELLTAFPVDDEPTLTKSCVRMTIQHMPTIEPERIRGKWVNYGEGECCDQCGRYPYDDGEFHILGWRSNFCPNCGADMREKGKMRLIDADALERDGWRMSRIVQIDEKTMEAQTRKPTDFPTIEPRSGRWIPHYDKVMLFDGISVGGMACSVCGWKTHNKIHLLFGCPYKYCPNCGADMRGEQDG